MFAESGEYYRAAKNARKGGLTELAIDCLQKIEPTNPHYQESLVELGQSFMERDLPGVAVEKLKKALHDQPLGTKNLDIYYTLAVASEQMGGYEEPRTSSSRSSRKITAIGMLSGGYRSSRTNHRKGPPSCRTIKLSKKSSAANVTSSSRRSALAAWASSIVPKTRG